jgi:Ser/Thr protein kinase RdoA (MazF antagonist)
MTLEAVYSTTSAAAIGRVVDACYAIGPVTDCRLFARGFNDTYELTGADGRRYMARLCDRRFRGPANVDYETAFLIHLDRVGIVVGRPLAGRDGRLWRVLDATEGPREFAVFTRLEGKMPAEKLLLSGKPDDGSFDDLRRLGANLAAIHAAGESYTGPPSLYRLDAEHLLARPLAQILAVCGRSPEVGDGAAALGESLRARLASVSDGLSIACCHGDNHGGNTVMTAAPDGERVCGWFDFDDSGPGFLAYDLAVFMWSGLVRARAAAPSEIGQAIWSAFIGGYRAVRAIADADFDAVALLVQVRHVNFVGQYASRIPEWGTGFVSSDWIRRELELIRKWDDLATPTAG